MPKIHYFQRYSTVENTVTNNTLQLLARIYDYSTVRASRLLTNITGEPIEIGIEINQQEKSQNSVPDGAIIQRSFKILIESKVDSPVDTAQLLRHASGFSNEAHQVLLLLTRQKIDKLQERQISKSIESKYASVIFRNVTFRDICDAIRNHNLFEAYESEMQALVEDYIEYCNDAELFDQSGYLMRIVPCGTSVDINRKYGIYFHPTDRGYTKHSFIGIYTKKSVQFLFEIDSTFDITLDGKALRKTLIQGRDTGDYDEKIVNMIHDARTYCGYDIRDGHRFFCGKDVFETDFKKVSFGGIQNARIMNLAEIIGNFSGPKDAAERLKSKTWE